MDIIGYISFLFVGVSLGLIGGGGSILAVPILVYLFNLPADISTSYSLFLVGASAAVGAYTYHRQGLIKYRIGFIFTVPAFLGVFLVRKFVMPSIPDLIDVGFTSITKDQLILGTFALVMLLASVSMIKDGKKESTESADLQSPNILLVTLEGLLVGGLTGFVGAGGGFLIIPALVLLTKMEMKNAVATSLLIIAVKSLFGFLGDLGNLQIDWLFIVILSFVSFAGLFLGKKIGEKISGSKLKKGFGYFVLIMGVYIIFKSVSTS